MQFISGLFFLSEPPPPAPRGHAHGGKACPQQQVGQAAGIQETLASGKAVFFFHTEAWKKDWNIAV